MWAEGVSAVVDICNGAETFALKRASRIRYHNFCELFGLGADPARAFALRDEAVAAGLEAGVTPHSTYSLGRGAFEAVVERTHQAAPAPPPGGRLWLAEQSGAPLSIHFLESEDEIDLFRRRGPLWDWYCAQGLAPDFLDYGSPAERLVAQVPPDRPVMLVHNCVATQRDIDIVMGHFTAPVTWGVCPGSTRYISGLVPPVDLLRRNGLRIAVGTDSLASNDTLSMIRELRLLGGAGAGVPLAELLGWTSADIIAPGHTPGIVLLTGVDMSTLSLTESVRTRRII
jgi:cytosine/adenosine deaminase-related metal-dependent hydrolase